MFATSNYKKMDCCRKIDGNKFFDISELFDVIPIFFDAIFYVLSFYVMPFLYFAFRCFVVLCFVIYPFLWPYTTQNKIRYDNSGLFNIIIISPFENCFFNFRLIIWTTQVVSGSVTIK